MGKKPATTASDLPERLGYLQPFRRKFASRPPEELNEDSGPPVLMPLLSKRIRGLSDADASQVLAQDRAALEQWLSPLGEHGDPLYFAHGFFLMVSPEDLVKLIEEEAAKEGEPKPRLQMELPVGAKLRKVPGAGPEGKLVILKGLWLAIHTLPKEALENLADATTRGAPGTSHSTIPLAFGEVAGRKIVTKGEGWRGPLKTITYVLDVPGGHVFATISAIGKTIDELNWDEAPFEACFHTLRVETDPPQPTKPHP